MNRILKLLIISDIFIWSGMGLISPILAIFINDNLIGGSIQAAGIASAIYLITHALLQILFSYKFNAEDRRWMLWVGTFFIVSTPFGYMFSTHIYHIYLVQLVYGVGAAFAYPSWFSLFGAHQEKGQRGFQWSIYNSSVSIGAAITAAAGAFVAEAFGFKTTFLLTGACAFIGLLILFGLDKKCLKKT
jgi:MFS family permease